MPSNHPLLEVNGFDVYVVTFKGNKELQASETGLSPLQLELMVLIDGRSTVSEIRGRLKSSVTDPQFMKAMQDILGKGYADHAHNQVAPPSDALDFFSAAPPPPSALALDQASAEVSSGISTLQQHGFYVRIAMRPSTRPKPAGGETVLIVEDDVMLAKFLRTYLELEGLFAITAANRNEIIAGLRRQPPPDLILLDVMLPDADGFNVLLKIREHPVLKSVPVLMLTAKATREAVLKGLAGGANGYITKPFQPDALITAVNTVLGITKSHFSGRGRIE